MSNTHFANEQSEFVITSEHLEPLVEYLKLGVDVLGVDVKHVDFVNIEEELTVEKLRAFDSGRIDFKKYPESVRLTKTGKAMTNWRWTRVYYSVEKYNAWAEANGKPVLKKAESYFKCKRISKTLR